MADRYPADVVALVDATIRAHVDSIMRGSGLFTANVACTCGVSDLPGEPGDIVPGHAAFRRHRAEAVLDALAGAGVLLAPVSYERTGPDGWYVMHDHGDGAGRHGHHICQHHAGSVTNPKANDHSGVEILSTFEKAQASWAREVTDAG